EEAIAHHLASRMEVALNGYEKVLSSHPGFVPARLYRSEALFLVKRSSEAREDLELARFVGSGLLLFQMLERTFGVSAADEPIVEKLLAAYPLEQHRFLATGTPSLLLLSMGEFEEAIADFRRVSPIDPDDATLHRQLGAAFSKAKLALSAVEAFERVVALAPRDPYAWRQLGSGNLVLQRWTPAIEAFERALEIEGQEEPGLLLALGYAHERRAESERALELYRRAARLAPRSGRPPYRIGRTLMAQGKLEEAEKAFRESAAIDPKMPEPLGFLGEIQLKRGENAVAIATLERAVEVDAEYYEAYYHLAQAYRRVGRDQDARKAIGLYEELKRKKRGVLSQEEVLALR
ncbi:MAG: tetratricopeptide repeat protein, partial [Vicinamibacteria bacterium]